MKRKKASGTHIVLLCHGINHVTSWLVYLNNPNHKESRKLVNNLFIMRL